MRRKPLRSCLPVILAVLALTTVAPALAQAPEAPRVYGLTPQDSSPPAWPQQVHAARGAPNILLIMTDDVGFGASSAFGGPVPTATFDALAREGLRYNRFHTTAICSPTRAALLTGRNPQAVGMGYVANWATGYEGYNSTIPKSAAALPALLRSGGYATAMFGKSHITPEWEMSASGPYDRWPTGLGFDYYYGFLGADTSAFEPSLVENTRAVPAPANQPGYHLEHDLADHAIRWIAEQKAQAPDRPFFVYYATGAAHAPNHAPAEWRAKFKGRFDKGWDVLRDEIFAREKAQGVIPANTEPSPRPSTLPRWDSLSPDQQKLYARYMEAYAAALSYADDQVGRVIQSLKDSGEYDNTLIVYIQGDNGASAEGSFDGKLYEQSALTGVKEDLARSIAHRDEIGTKAAYNLYPGGWGWAMNAPFQWSKRYGSHFGGLRNGMVVEWPHHIRDAGAVRSQFMHVSDIMPTLLDVAGVTVPDVFNGVPQQPVTGISARYTFEAPDAPSRRTTQVFAMAENLSLYKDGWVAATTPMATPWERTPPPRIAVEKRKWELYNIDKDFSEAHDLAAEDPARLERMKAEFWAEAAKAKILPIHSSEGGQVGRPDLNRDRRHFTYTMPMTGIAESAAPATVGHSFRITADMSVKSGEQGVIVAQGGRFGGYSLHLEHGRPVFTFNLTPAHITRVVAPAALSSGRHRVEMRLLLDQDKPTSGGMVSLLVDGKEAAQGRIERSFAQVISHTETFDIGQDTISAVDPAYTVAQSRFGGTLHSVTFDLGRD
ncbi:sulfatase-like hydrolase/transferase [Novosphingobium rosa]|uniref:sulfatase-like hydrolase/transferase n=1 Tax=Novosphingobium rosa TaxID=76978 RepID=UPI000A9B5785|nr:sulfatase-like hydrolase/transferase [Novosphingobium rosa]